MSEGNQSERGPVRISHSLNEAEKNYVSSRRQSALECLKRHDVQCTLEEMPNIALAASGGSERAMLGLLASLDALSRDDLLDCVLYLAGLSGSTWCMASLYKEANWSRQMEAVKNDLIQKLVGCGVSFKSKMAKLKQYYKDKEDFSLTDIWAVLLITMIVKEKHSKETPAPGRRRDVFREITCNIFSHNQMEALDMKMLACQIYKESIKIDEQTFSDLRTKQSPQDPYPIYTVIDHHSKVYDLKAETFCEITPHETGYCITGAFVDTSSFGSQFDQGVKTKDQPEMDMLFLQGLCGSGFASLEKLLEELIGLIKYVQSVSVPHEDKSGEVLLALAQVNLLASREEDPSSQVKILNGLLKDSLSEEDYRKLITMSREINKKNAPCYTQFICHLQRCWSQTCNELWTVICKCFDLLSLWIWGTTNNFVYSMTAEEVSLICKEEKRRYFDAGIANNSPFFPFLRKERQIDLIISLDFSENEPFKSLIKAQMTCKDLHIDFPEIPEKIEEETSAPKDFYVFEGQNKPTVIHIPLFNVVNCGAEIDSWRKKYETFQGPYSKDLIEELVDKAGMNIKNNKENLLGEIEKIIRQMK